MKYALLYAAPAFVFFLFVEWLVGRRRGTQIFERRDSATSIGMGVGRVVLGVAMDAAALFVLVGVRHASLHWLNIPTIAMDTWWQWVIAYIAFDLCFYWMHRGHHVIRIGWAGHVTHHSSQRFNLATALRQSWTEDFTAIPFWIPMAIVGFPATSILIVFAFNLLYQFWIHTELIGRLGPIEWIFNTPSHHRVHHGSDLKYLDRNFGGTLIIWDRLFGTFQKEEEKAHYGLITNIDTYNVIKVAFHEWTAMCKDAWHAHGFVNKVQTFFRPPGWKPGDNSDTVRMQRRALRTPQVKAESETQKSDPPPRAAMPTGRPKAEHSPSNVP